MKLENNSTVGKVVVIGIPLLQLGGTEMQTLSVVKVLVSAEYKVIVCCYHEYSPTIVDQFETAGAEVKLLKLKRQNNLAGLFGLVSKLVKAFRSYEADIVHVQYIAPGLIPIIAARLAGVKTVFATVHIAGSIAYGMKARWMLRTAEKLCTAFVCVSKDVERFWFGDAQLFDPDNIASKRSHFTIYNAVDVERIHAISTAANRDEIREQLELKGKKVIGILGRLAVQKGHAVLLDAMCTVVTSVPDTVLLIIGDGEERLCLEAQAEALGISEHIRWLGSMKQEDAFRVFSVMDIFAMPSLFEGFGLTAAEAMAAGLPVVGTSVDGLAEVVDHGNTGLLVMPDDHRALAEALIDLLSSSEKTNVMGMNGRTRMVELFSLKSFKQSILAAYQEHMPRQLT